MILNMHRLLHLAKASCCDIRKPARICFLLFAFTIPLSIHHIGLSLLGFAAVLCLFIAISLERPLQQIFPFSPLTVLLFGISIRCGLGPILMSISGSGGDEFLDVWLRYGVQSQILWLVFTATLLIITVFNTDAITRCSLELSRTTILEAVRRDVRLASRLKALAIALCIYFLLYVVLSGFSGAFDRRADSYWIWLHTLWRLDTPVAAFSRLRDLWFSMFPLMLIISPRWLRAILVISFVSYLSLALLSGSRGLLLYPALILVLGLWLVTKRSLLLRNLLILVASISLLLSPIIVVVRDSPQFLLSRNLGERLSSLSVVASSPGTVIEKARWIGRDLYACHDPYLFTPVNFHSPPAGFSGLKSLRYLYLPKHLNPNRPVIFDGHLIAKSLQGIHDSIWARSWFPCLSLPADLFRRGSWAGLVVGSSIFSILTMICLRFWYITISSLMSDPSSFKLLILFYPATYIQSFPFGTVSETSWYLLWELPKYVLALWIIGKLADRISRTSVCDQ